MVAATPLENVVLVRFPGPLAISASGEVKPLRSEIVCFIEVSLPSRIQVWYSHHEYFEHGVHCGRHHVQLDSCLDQWIRVSVMRELWSHFFGDDPVRPVTDWPRLPEVQAHPGAAASLPSERGASL